MKRQRVPGLVDLFEASDPNEIKALACDLNLDRRFEMATCPVGACTSTYTKRDDDTAKANKIVAELFVPVIKLATDRPTDRRSLIRGG